jgi:hypothetical protein
MTTDGAPRLEPSDIAALGAERGDQKDGRFDVSGGFKGITDRPVPKNVITLHDGSKPAPNSAESKPVGRST